MKTLLLSLTLLCAVPPASAHSDFVEDPYLQLGDSATDRKSLAIVWHTEDAGANWSVQYRSESEVKWRTSAAPVFRTVRVRDIAPHRVWSASLVNLKPGRTFEYKVLKNDLVVFTGTGLARRPASQNHRFVVFGDCAQGSPGQRAIAQQTLQQNPDFVMIPGDIVYSRGRISEYREKFFPVYNAETKSDAGVPLLRSTLFIAAGGNHDFATTDFDKYPDGLAYFYYWRQPLNGPLTETGEKSAPPLKGAQEDQTAFLQGASGYPQMTDFSFDYGDAHWTVIDSNKVVDWTSKKLVDWVEKDLESAKGATWRFVSFHHPGFNSSQSHFTDQWMRILSPVFEKLKVDIVFAGHVHNYQRTFPLTFVPKQPAADEKGLLPGDWTLDRDYDGTKDTHPKGVIYLVTGAGGAGLYNPEQQDLPQTWQPFTAKFVARTHSLTRVEVTGRKLSVKQISETGEEVDSFVVEK